MSIIPTRSVEEALRSAHLWGGIARTLTIRDTAAVTAGSTAAGSMSGRRMSVPFIVPSLTGPSGVYCMMCRTSGHPGQALSIAGQETELGSISIATGTFTSGSSMPVRRDGSGRLVQTASKLTAVYASAALTATTPTITITYTNQDGVGSRTCTVVLPSSILVNTSFFIRPDQLQAGDTGIQSIQNITKSAGSAGTLKVIGLNVITTEATSSQASGGMTSPMQLPAEKIELLAGDQIGFYVGSIISATQLSVWMNFLGSS